MAIGLLALRPPSNGSVIVLIAFMGMESGSADNYGKRASAEGHTMLLVSEGAEAGVGRGEGRGV